MKKLLPLALIAICLCPSEASVKRRVPPRVGQALLYNAAGDRVGTVMIRWEPTDDSIFGWKLTMKVVLFRAEQTTRYTGQVALYDRSGNHLLLAASIVLDTNAGGAGTANASKTVSKVLFAMPGTFDCQLVSTATGATIASDLTAF